MLFPLTTRHQDLTMTKKEKAKLKRKEDKARKRKAAVASNEGALVVEAEDIKATKAKQKRQKVVLFMGR